MLKFFKGLFGKKEEGSFTFFSPPPGSKLHDRNVGAILLEFEKGDFDGIRVSGAELSAKGVGKLAALKGLRALELIDSKVDDTAMSAFKGAGAELERLVLKGAEINGACFVKIGRLPKLEYLDVSGTPLVDMAVLAIHQNCPLLAVLDLSGTKITDQAVDYLGQIKKLQRLVVKDCKIDGAGLAMISHNTGTVIED